MNDPQPYVQQPYPSAFPVQPYWTAPQLRHSGLGVASFVLSLFCGIILFALVILAGVIEIQTPGEMDEDSPTAIGIGAGIIATLLVTILGLTLGIAAAVQRDRKKVFGILGLTLNGLIVLSVAGLFVIGLMAP